MRSIMLRFPLLVLVPLFAPVTSAQVIIDWVTIDDPGNTADPATGSLHGAVSEPYRIGTFAVTIAQYAELLNAIAPTDAMHGLYCRGAAKAADSIDSSTTRI